MSSGYYQVEVSDSNGCEAISNIYSFITGIKSINSIDKNIIVYPNPTSENAIIYLEGKAYLKVEVLTIEGKQLYTLLDSKVKDDKIQLPIPALSMANGIYIIRVCRNNNLFSIRFTVNR